MPESSLARSRTGAVVVADVRVGGYTTTSPRGFSFNIQETHLLRMGDRPNGCSVLARVHMTEERTAF